MLKILLSSFCLLSGMAISQTTNFVKAPNSYIYDIDLAKTNNYGGLEIPVVKAYEMWSKYEYLKQNGVSVPIPAGVQSASMFWEDVPGLITDVNIVPGANPADSKIKVDINKGKGKGNAVIAFKVNGTIYWSWHIWVTDNPENGVFYQHNTELDINRNPINIQYMDRNLGSTANSFLGPEWKKSGGLMYEWGRKDPFPGLVHKDGDFYEISGEVGVLRHKQISPFNTIPVQIRPFNEIEKNMKYAVNNPLTYIINTDISGNWFSDNRYKVAAASPDYVAWDLWSDNAKGFQSNGNSSNVPLRNESMSYELKSELDPCPNGWRIPSYYGRETPNNNLSFFGMKNWNNDDATLNTYQIHPTIVNPSLWGTRVYPGLGMDFTTTLIGFNGGRNIGNHPLPGAYVYYPNSAAPSAPVGIMFQDNAANGGLWSSTFAYDGARIFSIISDPHRTNTNVGLNAIFINQTNPTRSGNAVRCMRDPNLTAIGNFETAYFVAPKEDFHVGLDDPNSYIIAGQQSIQIPISKAYSVYNQLLSNHAMLPSEKLFAKVFWSTNIQLVKSVELVINPQDARLSVINVTFNSGQNGNAVISLHHGKPTAPALWSWHLWAPKDDPTVNTVSYTTENLIPTTYSFINPSVSKMPILKTTFMDRNLGAEESSLQSGLANGLHYQWGRKDPLPTFLGSQFPFVVSDAITMTPNQASLSNNEESKRYMKIREEKYLQSYTMPFDNYNSYNEIPHQNISDNILFSIQNPLHFLYQRELGVLYDGGNHHGNDLTKIKDWVSDQRGDADNRWGHADKKSPFDPCPEGWRVPDVSFTYLYTGSKGNSPWYNGYRNDAYGRPGVIQDQWHPIATYYFGTTESNLGWKFENPLFNIGTFPNDGIRGELGGNTKTMARTGVWTASLADLNTGFALAMQFEGNRMQTGTGVYPQAGMNVRCAKDENRFLADPVSRNSKNPVIVVEKPREALPELIKEELNIYPNPFKDEFSITNSDAQQFEIYDLSGKLVLKGNIQNNKVNATVISKGIYLLKIIMNDGSSVSKKLIKN